VHADWLDYDGTQVVAYEDDASRKILSIGEFTNATTDNAIGVFKRAEDIAREYRGKITAVNIDRGSQFYASGGEKKKKGVSRFKQYLNARGVKYIPSKRNNPQTNGKIERWFRSTEDIGRGLILPMRLQSGIITESMGHLIWNTLKLRMMHLSGK
jgi:transposase InsO family protein